MKERWELIKLCLTRHVAGPRSLAFVHCFRDINEENAVLQFHPKLWDALIDEYRCYHFWGYISDEDYEALPGSSAIVSLGTG